jgi:hypothetical protein
MRASLHHTDAAISMGSSPSQSPFQTVEELEQWGNTASDEEIVTLYEQSEPLRVDQVAYGRILFDSAIKKFNTVNQEGQLVNSLEGEQ